MKKAIPWICACLILLLSGCGVQLDNTNDHAQQSKVEPPIKAEFVYDQKAFKVKEPMKIVLKFTPLREEEQITVKWLDSGSIELQNKKDVQFLKPKANEAITIPITVNQKSLGKGKLKVEISVYDQSGKFYYGRNPSLYFLLTKDKVLVGKDGYSQLR